MEKILAQTLDALTMEEIDYILELAMDTDDWHTPTISDVKIHTQTDRAVYGYCNISKHNDYSNIEHWFNINHNTVHIWKEEYVRNKANKNTHRPIYNIKKLADILSSFK